MKMLDIANLNFRFVTIMAAKTTPGSNFDSIFRLFVPSFFVFKKG